jgi:hypothetical protein
MAKIAVGGSRSVESYTLVRDALEMLLLDDDILFSGNAPGADRLGERYAQDNGMEWKIIPSEWDKHGLKATMMRNEVLLKSADCVIIFWDRKSEGSRHMIDIALRAKKLLAVVFSDGNLKLYMNPRKIH